jgi:hypothetical protein
LAASGSTGGFSPGRTFGPVLSGPVRLGDGDGDGDGEVEADGVSGGGVDVRVAPPPVHAAASIRTTTAIGRNRLRTGKIVPDHLARAQPEKTALWTTTILIPRVPRTAPRVSRSRGVHHFQRAPEPIMQLRQQGLHLVAVVLELSQLLVRLPQQLVGLALCGRDEALRLG